MWVSMGRMMIGAGAILIVCGLALLLLHRVTGIGRLPGDIVLRRPGLTVYAPVGTMLLLSVLLTLALNLILRLRR